jgi:GNAT superfamily N-acetyltransferase
MNVIRRPATVEDTEFARRVHHAAYRDVVERQFGPWDEAVQNWFFDSDWRDAQHEIVLVDGTPCGYVSIEERAADIHVRELVVAPAFQGRGIGTTILQDLIERARVRGVPIRLGTHRVNRANHLYRRLGFRETGQTDTHILLEWAAS